MKIKLKDIRVVTLNTQTVILLSHFVRLARVTEGADLQMQQPDIVKRVFKYAETAQNPDLLVLFMRIKKCMKSHIRRDSRFALAA